MSSSQNLHATMSNINLLLLIIHIILIHIVHSTNVHYIKPSPVTQCPGESCLTLSTLAANSSRYLDSNTTLVFLEGSHTLNSELVISDITGSLTLSTNGSGTAAVNCDRASLAFFQIIQLQISGLEFIGCNSRVELVDQFTLEDTRFYGGSNDSALDLNHTHASIVQSSFISNTAGAYQHYAGVLVYIEQESVYDLPSYLAWPNVQSTSTRVGGALIVTGSTVSIGNSHFESNTAQVGGAIFSQNGSNITISNCTFVNNSATGCSDSGCHGGALFIDSGCTVTTHNSTFTNNTAGFGGGAIALFQGTFLDNAHNVFSNNRAGRYGGAVSAYDWSWIIVDNSRYSNNTGRYGGVIYTYKYSKITVSNSSFDNNEAGYGGVAFLYSISSITASNSSFDNNEAGSDGGVMYASSNSNITVGKSFFENNRASDDGGVMYASSNSSITVGKSFFENNRAIDNGGVVYAHSNSILTVGKSFFENNRAIDNGGVMYASSNSSITVDNGLFDNNEAGYGGVTFLYSGSSITMDNSSFNNNIAGISGGVMYASSNSSITVDNGFFDNNEAGYGGVTFLYSGSSITMDNSSFNNNVAGISGGVMYASSNSSITVGKSFFENNRAIDNGGVVYAHSNSILTVGKSFFENNRAIDNGGVMYASSNSSITVDNGLFDNNEAGYGGVTFLYSGSSITMDNSSFNNNVAGISGGVMYAFSNSSITVDNGFFDNNEAGYGGVTFLYSGSSITMDNSSFNNNVAGRSGGVMYASSNCSITMEKSFFENNRAIDNGGVIYASSNSNITVDNGFFDNNEAGNHAGVMYAYSKSNIMVDNSSFDNNDAGYHGGVMFAEDSSRITVGNSSFDSNVARNNGGVMCTYNRCNITVDNSSFNNNEAGYDGGVKFAYSGSSITVGNSSFDNNVADQGGAIYASSSSTITASNSFFDNNAGRNGGAMFASSRSSITVDNSTFDNNLADYGGAMYASSSSSITVGNSTFDNNLADYGGATYASSSSSITVGNTSFSNNAADNRGGVLCVYYNTVIIFKNNCKSFNNSAFEGGAVYVYSSYFKSLGNMYFDNMASNGGVILLNKGHLNIVETSFMNNIATNMGGVLYVRDYISKDYVTLAGSVFQSNQASSGGVIALLANDNLIVTECSFSYNSAIRGGVMYLQTRNKLTIKYSDFSHNSASSNGGAIYSTDQNILTVNNSAFNFNRADNNGGVLCLLFQTELTVVGDNCTFNRCVANFGGAIFAIGSQLVFSNGSCELFGNQAHYGGAVHANESKLIVEMNSWINVSANLAMHHGGGMYMTMSELNAKGYNLYINENQANGNGGGIYVTNSSIMVEGEVHLSSNTAENGGAISLERYAKLIGKSNKNGSIILILNRANRYGGALYVDDKTNPEMCAAITAKNVANLSKTECFSRSLFLSFSNNSAGISGMSLFGGLLDRCNLKENNETKKVGLVSFQNSTNINMSQLDTISSHPVQLCFCRNGQPDCNYQPEPIQLNRGKAFSLQLIAYNHISKPVRASVDIDSLGSGRIVGQKIHKACTEVELQFNLFTPVDYENLTLSVIGPCNVAGISVKNAIVKFTCICPIGFQILNNNETSCDCVCDQVLRPYERTECNPTTESIIRRENFWISYINHTWSNLSGYVIYPYCPFDYCYTHDKSVSINLNLPNGSDAQCDSNRTGTLCGTCKPGLSVSLGSSKCVPCATYWPGLLVTIAIVFIISGIGLVVFLLAINLTVAIGTLNAVIFYSNIVAVNKSALFPSGVSPASVFISWLNFDLGFNFCFFDGMDTYTKTWLQLAFPAYIIILVVVIIQLSYYSSAFGRLIGKKDPVATLATLILLSYAKLLQTIITAFSFANLDYPDGSKKTLWLPDATLEYFTSKHAVLFFIAIIILLAGLVYTFLLFSWQWLLKCPHNIVPWTRNQKLSSFVEIYLNPYTPYHRYWTGLLLLVRVSVYLVSAFNPSGDPRVTLSATNFIMTSLIVYIATFGVRMYKNRFINTMETLTYFNITALSIFTWYTIDADTNQTAITNISVLITVIQIIAVIVYHAYKHMNQKLYTTFQESTMCIKIKQMMAQKQQEIISHKLAPANENILLDMIDRPTNTDYNSPPVPSLNPSEPTHSVVVLPDTQPPPATPPPPLESEKLASEQDGAFATKTLSLIIKNDKNEQCNMAQSSQKVPQFPADSGQQEQEGCGSHCIIVEAESHNC